MMIEEARLVAVPFVRDDLLPQLVFPSAIIALLQVLDEAEGVLSCGAKAQLVVAEHAGAGGIPGARYTPLGVVELPDRGAL